ncbi:MAG: hypothetical protein KDA75_03780 [Planctomycetaceae bacterium]|nr:hypothetical protein [Planctomycetaceae bacterium]
MNSETAFGWRELELGKSAGLDFLGLESPIEKILDAETSGITNATERARYFSIMPWYYWKYTTLTGEGSSRDQRRFIVGFEMLLAYANIAWVEQTGIASRGIIRRDFCEKMWKKGGGNLPLRGDAVGDTPSPIDAAFYGPSLRRLGLLGRFGELHTCRVAGHAIALELEKTLGHLPTLPKLIESDVVDRATIHQLAPLLALSKTQTRENQLLRDLLFSDGDFAMDELPPRVTSFLLMLRLAASTEKSFRDRDIEVALALGNDLSGVTLTVELPLQQTHSHWRILALLKFLRHASEMAFAALHAFVRTTPHAYPTAESAAVSLINSTCQLCRSSHGVPTAAFRAIVDAYRSENSVPEWNPPGNDPEEMLLHACRLAAWCQSILSRDHGAELLLDDMSKVGQGADADLSGYVVQMQGLLDRPLEASLRWLLVERGVARHFQVAARKLVQHDTFRLIEDEGGVAATQSCTVAGVAIRIGAMLSLMADVQLLESGDEGYRRSTETDLWYRQQVLRLA